MPTRRCRGRAAGWRRARVRPWLGDASCSAPARRRRDRRLPGACRRPRALPRMTDGPFYPSPSYRARALDWDADLTTVSRPRPRRPCRARAPRGEHLDLYGTVQDGDGRAIDGAESRSGSATSYGSYRHPRGAGARIDAGFQGFGSSRSDARGGYRFRTIRPVPYTGPHAAHPRQAAASVVRRSHLAAVRRRRPRQRGRLPLSQPGGRRSRGGGDAAGAGPARAAR